MQPGIYDLSLYRGDTARLEFVLWRDEAKTQAYDLDGAVAAAQIRGDAENGSVIATLICSISGNTIAVTVPGVASLQTRGVWDLQITWPGGDVQTVVAGVVYVTADVTRGA